MEKLDPFSGKLKPDQHQTRRTNRWKTLLVTVFGIATLITVGLGGYEFLAVPTQQPEATVLIVEGWTSKQGAAAGVAEFKHGNYILIATSGLRLIADPQTGHQPDLSDAVTTAALLKSHGVPHEKVIACPAENTRWNRTSTSAQAVRNRLRNLGLSPTCINVVTIGPHGRQTRLAYQRMFGKNVRVGIIPVPHPDFSSGHWWTSPTGLKWMGKGFAGWLKECIFGLRN